MVALEGAFATPDGIPAPDQQIAFGRVRVLMDAPVAGTYVVTHPFGVETFEVTTPGPRAIRFTDDTGCFITPCDFSLALGSNIGPFLKAVNPAPPPGYIGDSVSLATVTGSPFGTNFFRIEGPLGSNLGGPGIDIIETNLFTVQGKIFK